MQVHCLGLICDVFNLTSTDGEVVRSLAQALQIGWTEFYQALKKTGGTYVLLAEADGFYAVLDACGTVPLAHGGGTVASHPRLIAEGRGFQISDITCG